MNPMSIAFSIAAAAVSAGAYFMGYSHEKKVFDEFVAQTQAQAAIQKAVSDHIVAQHERDKEDIHNDYQTRLADLRRQYSRGVQQRAGSGAVPTSSKSPGRIDAAPTYDQLAAQCAETTLQLTELQQWIKRTSK